MSRVLAIPEADLRRILREEVEKVLHPGNVAQPVWWTPVRLARHLGVHRTTIFRRISEGKLETRHAGGVREVKYP